LLFNREMAIPVDALIQISEHPLRVRQVESRRRRLGYGEIADRRSQRNAKCKNEFGAKSNCKSSRSVIVKLGQRLA
jgi:hypothetical protein